MRCIHPALPGVLTLGDGRLIHLAEIIGRGSHGAVHRATLESGWGVRRPVAVKIFDVEPDEDHGELVRRLGRVVRRAACVRHPAIVQTFEMDRTDGRRTTQPFVVSEVVCGESLATLIDTWRENDLRVPVDFALVVTLRAAEGLGAALFSDHVDGGLTSLVHGDVSSRQILVSDQGEVKIGDFGHGSLRGVSSHVRSRRKIACVAPEVACGLEPCARADVFSLGIVLHEMLVGPRFAKGTDMAEAVQMVRDGAIHIPLIEPNLPRELRAILERATAPNPADRYPHARALAFDLRREMLRLGLSDAHTCVRQAVVGFCEVRSGYTSEVPIPLKSDVVPKGDPETTSPEIRVAKLRRS
ncbi:MAG: serine/threonine protein kinase [Deltaproteobacteria bacterium]|nr:serine/threonine protein kinase [Deltaproteobacteria bacterium]